MGPREAALAARMLKSRVIVPSHYGTFPPLTGTPDALREELQKLGVASEVVALRPGETLG
jgi:L-ascorbate metabolism protein UlaG (beta-lactamase superfamily)